MWASSSFSHINLLSGCWSSRMVVTWLGLHFYFPQPHNTPGLGQYYADFVTTVRLVEYALGVNCDVDLSPALQRMVKSNNVLPGLLAAIPLLPIYASKATPGLDVSPLTRTLTRWCHQNASAVTSPTLAYSDQNAASAQAQPGPILPSYLPALGPSDSSSYSQSMVLTTPATNATTDATISRSTRYASSATETVDVHVSADTYASTHGPHRRRSHLGHSLTRIFRRANHHQRDVRPPRSPMGGQPFCLTTVAMPKRWQWAGDGESMAPHVLGPRAFNDHVSRLTSCSWVCPGIRFLNYLGVFFGRKTISYIVILLIW